MCVGGVGVGGGVLKNTVAGELCKLARVTGPEFPHPSSTGGRCLPATGRCHAAV